MLLMIVPPFAQIPFNPNFHPYYQQHQQIPQHFSPYFQQQQHITQNFNMSLPLYYQQPPPQQFFAQQPQYFYNSRF